VELILWKLRAIFVKKNCLSNSLKFLGRLRLKQILGRANRNKETISRQGMYAEGQQKNLCVWSNWIQFVVRMDTIQGPSQIPLTVWPRSPGSDTPQKIIEACQKSIPVVLLWNKKNCSNWIFTLSTDSQKEVDQGNSKDSSETGGATLSTSWPPTHTLSRIPEIIQYIYISNPKNTIKQNHNATYMLFWALPLQQTNHPLKGSMKRWRKSKPL